MTRPMIVLEPDPVEVADVALGLARWGHGRAEVERVAYVLGRIRRAIQKACAAITEEERTDALRAGLVWVRASDLLIEQSRKLLSSETGETTQTGGIG